MFSNISTLAFGYVKKKFVARRVRFKFCTTALNKEKLKNTLVFEKNAYKMLVKLIDVVNLTNTS